MQNVKSQPLTNTRHTIGRNTEITFKKQWRNIELTEETEKEYTNERR
jgi:hypothetical protein